MGLRSPSDRSTPPWLSGPLIPEAGCVGVLKDFPDEKAALGSRVEWYKESQQQGNHPLDVQKSLGNWRGLRFSSPGLSSLVSTNSLNPLSIGVSFLLCSKDFTDKKSGWEAGWDGWYKEVPEVRTVPFSSVDTSAWK